MSSHNERTDGGAPCPPVDDPILAALRAAPIDEEPFTDEERAAFDAAVEDYRAGRVPIRSSEEVLALLEQARSDTAE